MISRRRFGLGLGIALGGGMALTRSSVARPLAAGDLAHALARIETESGGRLGVAVLDTATDERVTHRGEERFPLCSTFKVLAAAAILARVDRGEESLSRRLRFGADAVVDYSPATGTRIGGDGMTVSELCEAALTLSDNTAGNLLLAAIGGPAGLTRYARSLQDATTRLDRIEPDLNEALPDDERDTTSPAAMAETLRRLVLSDALSPASREQLTQWLKANKTGDTRLRAGFPRGWIVGDKTGSGEEGTTNDVGVVWPPGQPPLVVTVYLTQAKTSMEVRSGVIARVARAIADARGA